MDPQVNPFAVLSLIAAPASLTNGCSLLAMSTSNRLARVDRARELSKQLEEATGVLVRTLEAIAVSGGILAVAALAASANARKN